MSMPIVTVENLNSMLAHKSAHKVTDKAFVTNTVREMYADGNGALCSSIASLIDRMETDESMGISNAILCCSVLMYKSIKRQLEINELED